MPADELHGRSPAAQDRDTDADGPDGAALDVLRRSFARMAWQADPVIRLHHDPVADVLTVRVLHLPAAAERHVHDRLRVELDGADPDALPTTVTFTGFHRGARSPADRTLRHLLGERVRHHAGRLAEQGGGDRDVPPGTVERDGLLAAWREFATRPQHGLGIEIVPGELRAVLVDERGEVIDHGSRPLRFASPRAVVEAAVALSTDVAHDRDAVIGVAIGGPVDRAGVVHSFTKGAAGHRVAWQDVPLGDLLAQELTRRPTVLNAVSALAALERWFGLGTSLPRYAVLLIDEGIGAALVVHGETDSDVPMELGNIVIHPEGRKCRCGNRGCVEATAGAWAIVEQVDEKVEEHVPDLAHAVALAGSSHDDSTTAEAVFHLAGQDLAVCVGSVQAIAHPEAWAVYLPPGLDGSSVAGRRFLAGLEELRSWVSFKPYGNCGLSFRTSTGRQVAHGAALTALERLDIDDPGDTGRRFNEATIG